mgnify:CR=1 FL=1
MKTLQIDYSEAMLSALNLSPESFEKEARISLAMKLYERGRLTSGQAAALAKISRVQFLLSCQQYGTASVAWDEDELNAEFEGAKETKG